LLKCCCAASYTDGLREQCWFPCLFWCVCMSAAGVCVLFGDEMGKKVGMAGLKDKTKYVCT
jgi:hypothetical protein